MKKIFVVQKMQEIADKTGIPVSLINNHHKNKEGLFDKIASSLHLNFDKITAAEERSTGLPSEKYKTLPRTISLIFWRIIRFL